MNISVESSQSRRGFTLIELLVVIAIIAILAAILLPALAAAKVKAQQVRCMSSVKQMDLALVMYPTDFNELLIPDIYQKTGATSDTGAWMLNLIDYYGRATNLFMCPTTYMPNTAYTGGNDTYAGTTIAPWASRLPRGSGGSWYFGSYGYNGWAFSDIQTSGANAGKHFGDGIGETLGDGSAGDLGYFTKINNVRWTSTTPMFLDQTWTDSWPAEKSTYSQNFFGEPSGQLPTGGANSMCRVLKARHGSGGGPKAPTNLGGNGSTIPKGYIINMGFADGHAEAENLYKMWTLTWHAKWSQSTVTPLSTLTPINGH